LCPYPIENYGHMWTQGTLCAWSRGADCRRRSRCARNVFGCRRTSTLNGHCRRQVELGVARSERFCLPAKVGPYSVHALDQVCARDAQAKSDGGIIPTVNHPPLQQNSVRLCQIPEDGATSAARHVLTILPNSVSVFHTDQDLAAGRRGHPTRGSVRGRGTEGMFEASGWRSGRLWRRAPNPIYRPEPGTYFPSSPDLLLPPQSPRVVQGQRKTRRITEQAYSSVYRQKVPANPNNIRASNQIRNWVTGTELGEP